MTYIVETRLAQALRADDPAPRDPMFRIEILVRRERAMFRRRSLIACATWLGAAIFAPLGLAAIGALVGATVEQLAVVAAAGVALAIFLAVSHTGTLPVLRNFGERWSAKMLSALWTVPIVRFWH